MTEENKDEVKEEMKVAETKEVAKYDPANEGETVEFSRERDAWRLMQQQAAVFKNSNALPKSFENVACVVFALQAGREIGLPPVQSLQSFYFVNGKISLYGQAAIGLVTRAGHIIQWGKCDDQTATVTITRGDNGASNSATFTMKQAKDRGLAGKDIWKKYPENMLRFKAFHLCSRFIVPDALAGHLIKEDLEGSGMEEIEITETRDVEYVDQKLVTAAYEEAFNAGVKPEDLTNIMCAITDTPSPTLEMTKDQYQTFKDTLEFKMKELSNGGKGNESTKGSGTKQADLI